LIDIALVPALLAALPALPQANQEHPPGFVLVKGGSAKIGTPVKQAEELIETFEELRNTIAGETPQHTVRVEDFYLMPTEVTNEQYAEYVKATGAKPPYSWAAPKDLEQGRLAYLAEQNERAQEALAKGLAPTRTPFDVQAWWDKSWQDCSWEVPKDRSVQPVTNVPYADAKGYCEWIGARLMSEEEYTRAARGDDDSDYPWGDEFDQKKAGSRLQGRDSAWPVASFPDGARDGIYDLVGNVWEWTSTPYMAFPGYKPLKITVGKGSGKRTVEAHAGFTGSERVCVGGSYAQGPEGLRVGVRYSALRDQSTDALGFRAATSAQPGRDAALTLIANTLDLKVLPSDVEFLTEKPLVLQRWASRPSESSDLKVEDYAVIETYERILFLLSSSVNATNVDELRKSTEELPTIFGVLSTTEPLVEPELPAGTYTIAWRGAGELPLDQKNASKVQDPQDPQAPLDPGASEVRLGGFDKAPGFVPDKDCWIVYDLAGQPILAFPAKKLDYENLKEDAGVSVQPWEPPARLPDGAPPPVPVDTLSVQARIPGRYKGKGFLFAFEAKIQPERWR